MEDSGISTEEFARLQNQLIELRTQNYEIAEKFKKTNDENSLLQKRIDVKEKELQKASMLMKIPGFGALTKNKNKKSYEEIIEENERLAHQMQRHEEDFNLQNKTLLEEVSRLATENEALSFEFEKLKDSRSREQDENDEIRRIKVENTVLHKKLEELEISRRIPDHLIDQNDSTDNTDNAEIQVDKPNKDFDVQTKNLREIIEELKVKFETEQTENKLLMEQLKDERNRSQMDITALKSEIDKLTEKTKRKQESFLHLQEEKEMLHKENRQLEEKLIISKEQHAKSEDRASKFGEELELTRNETENLKQESVVLKQKIEYCSPEKVTELENIISWKNEELMSLKSALEESASSNQSLMSEVQKLSSEKDHFEEMAKQNNELAVKRKNLLDKLSVERQHELTSHKEELQEARKEFEEQKKILEVCLSDLEKSKREITHTNDRHAELLQNYNSIEKKSGWLERTLKETEAQIEAERQENLVVSQRKEFEMEESIEAIRAEHLAELQKLSEEKSVVERERDEHVCVIEKLNQAAKDKEIEFRISSKKGDQLLKDLKRQLKTERKRADQIQQRLQDFLTESKCKQTFDELFKPEVSMYKGHRRQDSGSHLSTVSSNSGLELTTDHDNAKSSTPLSGTPLSGASDTFRLNDETIELISKVTDLQLEKNVLEERVRHLEENNSVMVDDLLRKTGIIQSYIRDTKADLHSENARKRSMTLKEKMKDSLHLGKQGKTEDMLKEMNAKMQRLLEETLEKNIQLERDIDFLTKELEKVSKQT